MKRLVWLLPAVLAVAAILLSVHMKRRDSRIEEDGGTRNYVDTNAPKVIHSTEITRFHCEFSTVDRMQGDTPIAGYFITLHAGEDGGCYILSQRNDADIEGRFTPGEAFFRQLQQLVSKYDFAQYNGRYYTVGGLPPGFGMKLEIQYASGETIGASNNQSCFLPLEAMEELVSLFRQS